MKIGIIGTGAIGSTIATKLATAGHQTKVYNTAAYNELKRRAEELGAVAATKDEITKDVDVVILSVPTTAIPGLSKNLFAGIANDVIVIDTANYYPFRDGEIEALKNGKVESVWIAETLGHPVIKAFNNLLAYSLERGGKPYGAPGRIAMAVSGDDQSAKNKVSGLINDVGFDAVDAGALAESWRHQPGTPAYCTELDIMQLERALSNGNKEDAAALRDLAITRLMERSTPPSHEEIVALNRSLFSECQKTFKS